MNTAMTASTAGESTVHGHVIMRWLGEATRPLSFDELLFRTTAEFGSDARFHTCDTSALSLPALLALLEQRGKVWREGSGYVSELKRMCSDHD